MNSDESELPFLRDADPEFRRVFAESAKRVHLNAGQFICMEEDQCAGLPIVIEGTARVYKMSDSGRELTLYRIDGGDSCVLTASCLASDRYFPAFAVAETEIDAWFVSATDFRLWLDTYSGWRRYVFDLFAGRMSSVIELVEEIAFSQMDVRLAMYLVDEAGRSGGPIQRTHEHIATDLGTSREVVSRLLKDFEKQSMVQLSRGSIGIIDSEGLSRLSHKS